MVKNDLPEATSLEIEGRKDYPRETMFDTVINKIDEEYRLFKKDGFTSILSKWKRYALPFGSVVKIKQDNGIISGQTMGIDDNGALILRLENGTQELITSGDLIIKQ